MNFGIAEAGKAFRLVLAGNDAGVQGAFPVIDTAVSASDVLAVDFDTGHIEGQAVFPGFSSRAPDRATNIDTAPGPQAIEILGSHQGFELLLLVERNVATAAEGAGATLGFEDDPALAEEIRVIPGSALVEGIEPEVMSHARGQILVFLLTQPLDHLRLVLPTPEAAETKGT